MPVKHSPLPWGTGTNEDASVIYDSNLGYVCDTGADDDPELEIANRDFIIRACNAHAAMLAACESILATARSKASGERLDELVSESMALVVTAIAKAKGQPQ